MRTMILFLAVLVASCSSKPSSTANEPTVTVDPCTGYLGEIERTGRPDRFARFASMHSMDTVDFWHLYRNGVQAQSSTFDSTSFDECVMAAYFNDTRRYPDSLHILLGNQRLISIAAVPSTRFLNAVYPIPLRKLFEITAGTGGESIELALEFSSGRGLAIGAAGTIEIVR